MASQIFNKIGQLGLGVALVGGVVNSALFNGKILIKIQISLLIVHNVLIFWLVYLQWTEVTAQLFSTDLPV